jgi:hypothetical protein
MHVPSSQQVSLEPSQQIDDPLDPSQQGWEQHPSPQQYGVSPSQHRALPSGAGQHA